MYRTGPITINPNKFLQKTIIKALTSFEAMRIAEIIIVNRSAEPSINKVASKNVFIFIFINLKYTLL